MSLKMLHTDSDIARINARYLEFIEPRVWTRLKENTVFVGGRFFAELMDLPVGVKEVTGELVGDTGRAVTYDGKGTSIPLVNAEVTEVSNPVHIEISAFEINFFELEAIAVATANGQRFGADISTTLANVAVDVVNERCHLKGAYGDPDYGTTGFINNASVPLSNDTFDPYNVATTADEIKDYVVDNFQTVVSNTNLKFTPNLILTTLDFYMLLVKTYRSGGTDKSLLNILLDDLGPLGLRDIVPLNELQSARLEANGVQSPATNKERMVVYRLDPEVVYRRTSPIGFLPSVRTLTGMQTPVYKAASEVIWRYPTAGAYFDFPKKT